MTQIKYRRYFWICGLLALAFFLPVISFGLLDLDDRTHLVTNPHLQNFSGLIELWKQPYFGMYIPVVYTLWWSLKQIVGDTYSWFHLLNVLAHVFNSLLILEIVSRRLKGAAYARLEMPDFILAVCAMLLFALHPLQGSSIAWMSELRTVLGATFILLSVLFVQKFEHYNRRYYLFMSGLFFVTSILCKPQYIAMSALAPIFIRGHKLKIRQDLFLVFLSLIFVFPLYKITKLAQPVTLDPLDFFARWNLIGSNLTFYIEKFFWPFDLTYDHGLTREFMSQNLFLGLSFVFILLFSLGFEFLVRLKLKRQKIPYLSISFFFILIICLSPVLGVVDFSHQYYTSVAERYMYPVVLGISLGLMPLLRSPLWASKSIMSLAGGIFLIFSYLIWTNMYQYRNSVALGESNVRIAPTSFAAKTIMALAHIKAGRKQLGEKGLLESLQLKPDYWLSHQILGELYISESRWLDMKTHFEGIVLNKGNVFKSIPSNYLGEYFLRLAYANKMLGEQSEMQKNLNFGRKLAPEFWTSDAQYWFVNQGS